jgi:hypothetical protein
MLPRKSQRRALSKFWLSVVIPGGAVNNSLCLCTWLMIIRALFNILVLLP